MKVLFKESVAGRDFAYKARGVYEVDKKTAAAYAKAGYCVLVPEEKKEQTADYSKRAKESND